MILIILKKTVSIYYTAPAIPGAFLSLKTSTAILITLEKYRDRLQRKSNAASDFDDGLIFAYFVINFTSQNI